MTYREQDASSQARRIHELEAEAKRAKRKRWFGSISDVAMMGVWIVAGSLIGGTCSGFIQDKGGLDDCTYDCATQEAQCIRSTDRGSVCKLNGRYFTVPEGSR